MKSIHFQYLVLADQTELNPEDAALLAKARQATQDAYAPYSKFNVAAVALLNNGEIITGTNQENASYPIGICAERVLLSAVSSIHGTIPINTIAISYHNQSGQSARPISPCGLCRQSLLEQTLRQGQPIRLILSGLEGEVFIINNAANLLPLSFTANDMQS